MNAEVVPYLVLGSVIVGVAAWKGYLPWFRTARKPQEAASGHHVEADALEGIPSETLGLAYAKAVRREAEEEIAAAIAKKAGESIRSTFTAPFSGSDEPAPPAAR